MTNKHRKQLIKKGKGLGSQLGDGKTLEDRVFCATFLFICIAFMILFISWGYNR